MFLWRSRTFLAFWAAADKQFCVFLYSRPIQSLFDLSEVLAPSTCPAVVEEWHADRICCVIDDGTFYCITTSLYPVSNLWHKISSMSCKLLNWLWSCQASLGSPCSFCCAGTSSGSIHWMSLDNAPSWRCTLLSAKQVGRSFTFFRCSFVISGFSSCVLVCSSLSRSQTVIVSFYCAQTSLIKHSTLCRSNGLSPQPTFVILIPVTWCALAWFVIASSGCSN